MVALDSASVIYFPFHVSELELKFGSNSMGLNFAMNYFVKHSSVLCQGIL